MGSAVAVRRIWVDDGVSLPVAECGPESGPCVLLVHGMGDSWRSYAPVLEHMPDDLRVVVPSLRGHGDADRPDQGYTPTGFVSDLVAVLDDLGVEQAVIGGHSSGALVAQLFAIVHPGRCLGIVLVGAPRMMRGNPDAAALDAMFATLEDPVDADFVRGFTEKLFAGTPPPEFLDMQVAETLKVPARVIRATWAGLRAFDISSELGHIGVPTLIIWGDHDHLALSSRQVQDDLLQAIPDADLHVYQGVGHSPHWERPARLAADVASFVHQVV